MKRRKFERQAVDQDGPFNDLPDAPVFLSEGAKTVYLEAGSTLIAHKLLNAGNYALLLAYAQEMAAYFEAAQKIAVEGVLYTDKNGQTRQHPLTRVARSSFQNALAAAHKLHLTPEIQQRLPVAIPKETQSDFMRLVRIAK